MDEQNKNIDQAWKDAVEKEKKTKGVQAPKEPDFNFFVSMLGLQASVFLGQIPNPVTQKKEDNLIEAKLLIDTLGLLKEKTRGNLTPEEEGLLENMLYELRMQYISKIK